MRKNTQKRQQNKKKLRTQKINKKDDRSASKNNKEKP